MIPEFMSCHTLVFNLTPNLYLNLDQVFNLLNLDRILTILLLSCMLGFSAESSNFNTLSGSRATMHLAAAPHHPTVSFFHLCKHLFQDQSTSFFVSGPLYGVCQRVVGEPPSCCKAASLVHPDAAGNTRML